MTHPGPTTPRRRFRPRLSLRALMLLILVVGAGLGLWAAERAWIRRNNEIIATLQSAGLSLGLDTTRGRRIVTASSNVPGFGPRSRLTTAQTRALGECPDLLDLTLATVVTTDETTAMVARSPKLSTFYCFQPEVTDAGLVHLGRLGLLQDLGLIQASRVTDAGLAPLARLASLEELTISGANLRGPGLAHLAGLPNLISLAVPNNPLDDAGLATIGRLTRLRKLYIGGGSYTDAGLAHLGPLTGLTELGFGTPRCTPAALDHLAGMRGLDTVAIAGPPLSDEWLDRIAARQPASLRTVVLDRALTVSDAAIARLHAARPEIRLTINGQPR